MTTPSSAETSLSPPPPPSVPKAEDTKRFRFLEIPRSKIQKADYNPRDIDPYALNKLAEGIEEFGLVETLVWNETTGVLVGGHQRLTILDRQHTDGEDYLVPVSAVSLSPEKERELNVFLNNETTQGVWDTAKLEMLFRDGSTSPFAAGFDAADLQQLFPTETVVELIQKYLPDSMFDSPEQMAEIPGTPPPDAVQQAALDIMEIKAARNKHRDGSREDLRADHIVVMVFDTSAQAKVFLGNAGLDSNMPYFLAEHILTAMGCERLIPEKPLDASAGKA